MTAQAPAAGSDALLREVLAELRALRLAVEGKRYRDQLLRELAGALALGPTWACAQQLALVVAGARDAPDGMASTAAALRADADCPRSPRQLLRILQTAAERAATDKAATLCQWPIGRHDLTRIDPDSEDSE